MKHVENIHTAPIVLASGVEIPVGGSVDLPDGDVKTSGLEVMIADGLLQLHDGSLPEPEPEPEPEPDKKTKKK